MNPLLQPRAVANGLCLLTDIKGVSGRLPCPNPLSNSVVTVTLKLDQGFMVLTVHSAAQQRLLTNLAKPQGQANVTEAGHHLSVTVATEKAQNNMFLLQQK